MRVLIIDDDEIALELLQNTLVQAGYEVEAARDGRQALEILRTGLYRLVISDWEMPEINGIELCRRIRARPFTGYIYIILVTARDGTNNVVEGLNAGADDFVTKPFKNEELLLVVKNGLEKRSLKFENKQLKETIKRRFAFENIIGKSAPMQQVFDLIKHVGPSRSTVLVSGERVTTS